MVDRSASWPPAGWEAWRPKLRHWRRYWLRDPFLGSLDYGVHYSSRGLPTDLCSAIGGVLGRLNGKYRYLALRERSERLYRELSGRPVSTAEVEAAIRRLFDNVGRVMLEFSMLDRLYGEGRVAVEGAEHLHAARASGRPVIVMGVHVGNWEIIGPTLLALGVDNLKFIYQPPRSRFEHALAVTARERCGLDLLPASVGAAHAAHRLLVRDRGTLLIYGDDERKGRVNAPLFGRELLTRSNIVVIARLAMASGAIVIPASPTRIVGAQFRLRFLPGIALSPAATVERNALELDRVLTPLVQSHLDQWYMLFEQRN